MRTAIDPKTDLVVEPNPKARGYDVCELNADGVDYIGPVLAQIRGESSRPVGAGQTRLFG